jgi:hypothetical protein
MKIFFICVLLLVLGVNANISISLGNAQIASIKGIFKGMKASDVEITKISDCLGSLPLDLQNYITNFIGKLAVSIKEGLEKSAPSLADNLLKTASDINTLLNEQTPKTCIVEGSTFLNFILQTSKSTTAQWKETIIQIAKDDSDVATINNYREKAKELQAKIEDDPSDDNFQDFYEYLAKIYMVFAEKVPTTTTTTSIASTMLSTASILTASIAILSLLF